MEAAEAPKANGRDFIAASALTRCAVAARPPIPAICGTM